MKRKRKGSYKEKIYGKHLKTIIPIKPLSFVVVGEVGCSQWPSGQHLGRLCQRL